jgi:hypothetical protein
MPRGFCRAFSLGFYPVCISLLAAGMTTRAATQQYRGDITMNSSPPIHYPQGSPSEKPLKKIDDRVGDTSNVGHGADKARSVKE